MKILFLSKDADALAAAAAEHVRAHVRELEAHACRRGQPFPKIQTDGDFDYVLSYLCPLVVPADVLSRASIAALNFHPGPPEYPGIGCTNFALYDDAPQFGVTCHCMARRVDSGAIVAVRRFPIHRSDTVSTLTRRCHSEISTLFYEIFDAILAGKPLVESPERWTRRPLLRTELDALCRIDASMSADEIRRRVRATHYPGYPGPFVELAGHRFELGDQAARKL
jgi:methionyl-tRNA formyltransferase